MIQVKGGGKGCAGKKGAPASAGKSGDTSGREVFSEDRLKGTLLDWKQSWGWIEPEQRINNPIARNLRKVYVHVSDVRYRDDMKSGVQVEFLLYKDERGVGATDVSVVSTGEEAQEGEDAAEEPAAEDDDAPMDEDANSFDVPVANAKHPPAGGKGGKFGTVPMAKIAAKPLERISPTAKAFQMPAPPPTTSRAPEKISPVVPKAPKASIAPKAKASLASSSPQLLKAQPMKADLVRATNRKVQRVRGRVVKWASVFGWITPSVDLPSDLKPLLIRFNNSIYVNWRNVQQGVKMDVGLNVDFVVEADDNGLVALDIGTTGSAGVQQDPYVEVQKALGGGAQSWAKAELAPTFRAAEADAEMQDEEAPADEDAPMEEEAEAEPDAEEAEAGQAADGEDESHQAGGQGGEEEEQAEEDESPLPPGWTKIWSAEHEDYYFWHKATKQPSWERPVPEPEEKGKGVSSKGNITAHPKGKGNVGKPNTLKGGNEEGKGKAPTKNGKTVVQPTASPYGNNPGTPSKSQDKGGGKGGGYGGKSYGARGYGGK